MIEKKTKVICTIGPASDGVEKLRKLAQAGMNVTRLNFSHGTHEAHQKRIEEIRQVISEGYNLGILLDTKGPEIRICKMPEGGVQIYKDHMIKILMTPIEEGTAELISVTYPKLIDYVKIGTILKLDDGKVSFEVTEINKNDKYIICKILNDHILRPKKSVGVPFTKLNMPFISKKDEEDLIFACDNKVDYIAASFTRSKFDIMEMRSILDRHDGQDIKILAKIENEEGVENIDEILQVADGVMVARGDLGIELSFEDVPVIQRSIIRKATHLGKIVVIATQMLESMQHNPAPTRAEVSDVANAVYSGVDAIMLSGETANGLYPIEACTMETRIAKRVEIDVDYKKYAEKSNEYAHFDNNDAIAYSVTSTALITNAKLIICFSKTGNTARRISFYRPECPIISISDDPNVIGKLALNYGVYGEYLSGFKVDVKDYEQIAREIAKKYDVKSGESVILTGGEHIGNTNFMKIVEI